ncbi:GrpB-like predicted nucleotidyltransferase (UPF0157 family) [Diaminobutyricimonas aerilata]|uniref:GrpB-like predicted nucleotidyltransferase (UPF0157 family) n=1 Tax=Diaminobutyricimonas aerilata TaxID=1162967 RepID=A0A2M9CLS5_9MICO|nr:GrpB family protein [Diaminobutyricimonas aerilata]PJJ72844.1 GrpB-like predicted nucleotidyltransferase (UPF0157 family) [Diaminobutyricimonas aerilata]
MPLQPADVEAAARIRDAERARLDAAGIGGELELVGGSSVTGALTHGDIDLHLRVPVAEFDATVELMYDLYVDVKREIWQPTLAAFERIGMPPVGVAVTPLGSEHDERFSRSWTLLRAHPELITEYNAMKRADDGPDGPGYEARKSAFFDHLVAIDLDDP